MSEIDALSSSQPSLIEEIINSPDTISNPCHACIESSSSIDELKDKLTIIENSNNKENLEITNTVNRIQNMMNENHSLKEIKNAFSNE